MEKQVSIIIPYYNGKNYIKETVSSCFNQQYTNIEVIIIDDCSNSENYIYLQNMAKEFCNIKVLHNNVNRGLIYTCNRGSEVSAGEYLLFLGQDDILPYSHIYNCIKCFDEHTAFVYSIPLIINERGEICKEHVEMDSPIKKDQNIYFNIAKENVITSTGLIINRSLFEKAGKFDPRYRNYGEWHLWIRLLKVGKGKLCITEHALYRHHSNNLSKEFSDTANINKQIMLHKYWNDCRKLAARSFHFNLKQKIKLVIYRKKITLCTYLAVSKAMLHQKSK